MFPLPTLRRSTPRARATMIPVGTDPTAKARAISSAVISVAGGPEEVGHVVEDLGARALGGQAGQQELAVRTAEDAPVQQGHDPAIAPRADEPAEALLERQRGAGQLIIAK